MLRNQWLVFPQFCWFLTNCFPQSVHNIKVVFVIDRVTLLREFMTHHKKKKKNSEQNFYIWPNLAAFPGLVFWTHLWLITFLNKSGSLSNIVNVSWAISKWYCFCSKFSIFGTIFADARYTPKTTVKIYLAWAKRYANIISHISNSVSMIIQNHFRNCFNVFISCWRARSSLTSSRSFLSRLYHNWTCFLLTVDLSNATVKISHLIPFLTQNIIQFLCFMFSNSRKIKENTLTRLMFLSVKNTLTFKNGWYCQHNRYMYQHNR